MCKNIRFEMVFNYLTVKWKTR